VRNIVDGLEENKSIHTLDVSHISLKRWHKEEKTVIIKSLKSNRLFPLFSCHRFSFFFFSDRTLTKLKMSEIGMEKEDVRVLEQVLRNNTTLSHLDVSYNKLGKSEESWRKILSKNTLTHLSLSLSGMDPTQFLNAITSCTSLQHLDFSSRGRWRIDAGFAKLALVNNTNLTHLDFDRNVFTGLEMDVVARDIRQNSNLTFLNFGSLEQVEGIDLISLARAIGNNTSLISFSVGTDNRIDVDEQKIGQYLSCNSNLTSLNISALNHFIPGLIQRNRGYWRERLRWGWKIVGLARLFFLSNGKNMFPSEIIFHILSFIPSPSLIRKRSIIKMIKYGADRKTLARDRANFSRYTFGVDIYL